MEKEILIIGGTGTMGRPLVDILFQKGYSLSVVCRKKQSDTRSIKYYYGNAKDVSFIGSVLNQHFHAIVDFCVYKSEEFKRNIPLLLASTDQYICLSSAAVYADQNDAKTEDSPRYMETEPPVCGDRKYLWYCYEKARIEDILRNSPNHNWTIVRPGITVNHNHIGWGINWGDDWFLRVVQGKKVIIEEDVLPFKVSFSYGGHVAMMIAALVGNQTAFGETYNVTSTEEFSWQELLDIYKKEFSKLGYTLREKHVLSEEMIQRDGNYEEVYRRARLLDRRFDSTKIRSMMGTSNFTPPIADLIELWMADIVKAVKTPSHSVVRMANVDRLTGDKSSRGDFNSNGDYIKYTIVRYVPQLFSIYSRVKQVAKTMIK